MARKSTLRFLNADHPDVIAAPVPVDGVFTLIPPSFEPLHDEADLDDGTPPTAVGRAVMEWYAKANECAPEETPTSIVRAIEAISATPENVNAIRRARWRRNSAGLLSVAQIEVLVPMIRPATVQPRMAASAQRIMRDTYHQSLVHEVNKNLVIRAQSAQHLLNITSAQKKVRDPDTYIGSAEKDFADSIALEGIREELRGFVYQVHVSDDEYGHLVETDDGWTRVTVAQSFMGQLMETAVDLSTLHWEHPAGTLTVRSHTADTIDEAFKAIRFPDAAFQVWPNRLTMAGIKEWIATASPEALATIRMITARMDVGIAVRPYQGHSDHDVVYADMARFHVKGQNPTLWGKADDEAFKARTVVNDLVWRNYITPDERDVYFGDTVVPWHDDPEREPHRNRVVATTKVMVATVVDDPASPGRYHEVRTTLKRMRVSNSPLQAATTTASLAGLVAGLDGDGEMGQFTAAIARSFRKPELRCIKDHTGNWTEVIDLDITTIAANARIELNDVLGTSGASNLGRHQRALAVLALVAHASNPALRNYRKDVALPGAPSRLVRYPSSLTLTGRGGRGGVKKLEADVIVFNAVRSPEGIDQLEAIVKASVEAEPIVPTDPATGDDIVEEWLRQRWEAAPDHRGRPARSSEAHDDTTADEVDDDQSADDIDPLSEPTNWQGAVISLVNNLGSLAKEAEGLSQVPANAELAGIDEEDYDPDDESVPSMLDAAGIDPEVESGSDEYLETLRKFLKQGVMAYLMRRAR